MYRDNRIKSGRALIAKNIQNAYWWVKEFLYLFCGLQADSKVGWRIFYHDKGVLFNKNYPRQNQINGPA